MLGELVKAALERARQSPASGSAGDIGRTATHDDGWFGASPATVPFGAHDFDATSGTNSSGLGLNAHSPYWDTGSKSLQNMGNIVVGNCTAVTPPK